MGSFLGNNGSVRACVGTTLGRKPLQSVVRRFDFVDANGALVGELVDQYADCNVDGRTPVLICMTDWESIEVAPYWPSY
jgi:hypothetical protein